MSVRVRLTRVGSKSNPVWRVVVADQRSPRDGRIIESLGHYNPRTEPSTIVIDRERLRHWVDKGAQPTNTVRKLMRAPNTVTAAAAAETATEAASAPTATEASPASDDAPAASDDAPAASDDAPAAPEDAPAALESGTDPPAGVAASDQEAGPSGAAVEASAEPEAAPGEGAAAPEGSEAAPDA